VVCLGHLDVLCRVECRPEFSAESQEQGNGTIPRNLTTTVMSSMMWRSSARRRRGLARDALRTSVPVAANPH
jgi:hypothetical protein